MESEPEKLEIKREMSSTEILQKLSSKELILLILNLYSEAEDAAHEKMKESYGEEIANELIRDFFKGMETWMRKHNIVLFHEQYCLVTILNAQMYRSIHNNLAKSMAALGDIRHESRVNDTGSTAIGSTEEQCNSTSGDLSSSGTSPSSNDHSQEVSER